MYTRSAAVAADRLASAADAERSEARSQTLQRPHLCCIYDDSAKSAQPTLQAVEVKSRSVAREWGEGTIGGLKFTWGCF